MRSRFGHVTPSPLSSVSPIRGLQMHAAMHYLPNPGLYFLASRAKRATHARSHMLCDFGDMWMEDEEVRGSKGGR